CMQALEYSWTF
nr:immunoglobulin light chain junction region [Macaca mulatta]